jgi:hypothetical protein
VTIFLYFLWLNEHTHFSNNFDHNVYTKKVRNHLITLFLYDHNVYKNKVGKHLITIFLYVYDLILNCSDPKLLIHMKSSLEKKFEMTNLCYLHYFHGLQILQTREGISLSDYKYACDLLHHFHIEYSKMAPSSLESNLLPHVLFMKSMPLCTVS